MRLILLTLIISNFFNAGFGQKVTNDFFALHNIIRGDSVYNTFDKQVQLIQGAGFDGIEINQVDSFEGMKSALDKYHFRGSYFYVRVNLEEPYIDSRLKEYISRLCGSKTIIAPYIIGDSKKFKSSNEADSLTVGLVSQIAGWAGQAGLQVAIYPHVGFYVETTDHALALVKRINLKNTGLSFNLCHWMATTPLSERGALKIQLKELNPYLKMVTIAGANNVQSNNKNIWNDYILPLGKGNFDNYDLLKYLVRDLKFKGPIGVQCYDIKGDKSKLVQNTISVWKDYKSRLESDTNNH
jgi:sugar phosphate isomerase/epimerase